MEGDVKAVVIIKLPSPDNPSEDKVMTRAIALTESYTGQNPNPNPIPIPSRISDEAQVEGCNVLPLCSAEVNKEKQGEGFGLEYFRLKRVIISVFCGITGLLLLEICSINA